MFCRLPQTEAEIKTRKVSAAVPASSPNRSVPTPPEPSPRWLAVLEGRTPVKGADAGTSAVAPNAKCPDKHTLESFITDAHNYSCSKCGNLFMAGTRLHGCRVW